MSPYDQIRNAVNVWGFALFLREAVERGSVTSDTFVKTLKIDTGAEGLAFQQNYDHQALDDLSYNLMFSTLGTCVIQVDTALDQVFAKANKREDPPGEIASARSIIYMLRCAFAHDPLLPKWEARNSYYHRLFEVPSARITLDLRILNGQYLVPNHFGGWEAFTRLLFFCRNVAQGGTP